MILIHFDALLDRVADECSVTRDDILGRSRSPDIADARAIAVYCVRRLFRQSYPQLGELFGRRRHPTVLYLDRRAQGLLRDDKQLARIVERVMNQEAA